MAVIPTTEIDRLDSTRAVVHDDRRRAAKRNDAAIARAANPKQNIADVAKAPMKMRVLAVGVALIFTGFVAFFAALERLQTERMANGRSEVQNE
jgi:hypothetical protein